MKNDGSYFLYFISQRYKPALVYPFEWQGIQFFVHKVVYMKNGRIDDSSAFRDISHKDTGLSLGITNTLTIREAKEIALNKLNSKGLDGVQKAIEEGVKMCSPVKVSIKVKDSEL